MVIYVLIGIGIVLFTLGASFVLKAYLNTPKDNTIVPKLEFDKVNLELIQSKESETKLIGQIEQLIKELETAKQNLEASRGKEETALKNLQEWQTKTASNEETYKTTIHQLETELNLLREKAETQAKGALEMVTSLTAENDSLKGNSEALKLKDEELEKNKESLKTLTDENARLKSDLQSSPNKHETDLQRDLEKIKEINAAFLKKEEMIQYELTKARIQAMGLEKISEDFKTEIEKQLQEINNLKSENNSLRKLQEAKG